eukprot:7390119-Alexandrium_andersonii.AAC.1
MASQKARRIGLESSPRLDVIIKQGADELGTGRSDMLQHSKQAPFVAIQEVVQEARSRPELLQASNAMRAEDGIRCGRGALVPL